MNKRELVNIIDLTIQDYNYRINLNTLKEVYIYLKIGIIRC